MYERTYGTDWETLEKDEAAERAFALGVAAELGDPDDEEYERILAEAATSYDRSIVELAYAEGKRAASGRSTDTDDDAVWEDLVEDGPKTTVDEDEIPTGDRDGLPAALESLDLLDRPLADQLEAERLPEFLRK